jgi:hypothetical protein
MKLTWFVIVYRERSEVKEIVLVGLKDLAGLVVDWMTDSVYEYKTRKEAERQLEFMKSIYNV